MHVGVEGTDKVSESDITAALSTYSDNFGSFDSKPLLDLSILEEDQRRVESAYAALGYFDARCTGHRVEEVDDVSVRVFFQVVEGGPTTIRTLTVRGLEPPPDDPEASERLESVTERLRKLLPMEVGDIWLESDYFAGKAALHEALRALGFVHAEVVGETRVDARTGAADVTIDAVPGPLARIDSVHVLGNTTVPSERVLRRVELTPGEVVDPERFDRIVGRLFELGVFYSVSVKPERVALDVALAGREATAETLRSIDWPKTVRVAVTVQEKPLQEIRAGGGVELESEQSVVNVEVGYQNLSFFGGERFFDIALKPNYSFRPSFIDPAAHSPGGTASLEFRQPAFLEEYLVLSSGTEYSLSLDSRRLLSQSVGTSLTLSRSFWNVLTPSFTVSFNLQNSLEEGEADASTDPYIILTALKQALTFDWRDNLLDPRRGIYAQIAVAESFAELGSDYDFVQFEVDFRGYVKPASWLTLALRTSYSENFTFRGAILPVEKLFKGGGASDMRGFSGLQMGPKSCSYAEEGTVFVPNRGTCPEGTDEYYDGGNIKTLASFEARFYLPYDLGLVAFVDTGQIWTFAEDRDWTQLDVAVGPGLRYYTVIGPIRFDVGFLVTNVSEVVVEYHLSIGQAF